VVLGLCLGRLLGVGLLSQLMLVPATDYIQWAARWVSVTF
jgi:hypothetical protein